eukprot:Skav211262  [mRNA]  locus=scaffold3676:186391:188895:+ [translate_table: standard]
MHPNLKIVSSSAGKAVCPINGGRADKLDEACECNDRCSRGLNFQCCPKQINAKGSTPKCFKLTLSGLMDGSGSCTLCLLLRVTRCHSLATQAVQIAMAATTCPANPRKPKWADVKDDPNSPHVDLKHSASWRDASSSVTLSTTESCGSSPKSAEDSMEDGCSECSYKTYDSFDGNYLLPPRHPMRRHPAGYPTSVPDSADSSGNTTSKSASVAFAAPKPYSLLAKNPQTAQSQNAFQPGDGIHPARCCEEQRAGKQPRKEPGSPKGNVPKPEVREKLSAGCTDNICFLTKNPKDKPAEDLAEREIVKKSGFHEEVRAFLDDPDFGWNALAVVRMPAYQSSTSYAISADDPAALGVVAIKSSVDSMVPLKVSVGVWLQKEGIPLTRRIISQVVLQVFGTNPLQGKHDVRRNHQTLKGVGKTTQVEVQITSFTKDGKLQSEPHSIDLRAGLGKDGLKSLKQAFLSYNLKLTGAEQDFTTFAELVTKRLKSRPKTDKSFKTAKDFTGEWLPGNLFKCAISEQLARLHDPNFRKELDGHIVVLLPSRDKDGPLPFKEDQEVIVAVVDTRKRKTMLVPRIALHPLDCEPQHLKDFLLDKYKFEVQVKCEERCEDPRHGQLCMNVVRSGTCMVQYSNAAEPEPVNPAHLCDPRGLRRRGIFGLQLWDEGEEARTVKSSEMFVQFHQLSRSLQGPEAQLLHQVSGNSLIDCAGR